MLLRSATDGLKGSAGECRGWKQSLCTLCILFVLWVNLCQHPSNRRDTEDTEVTQRNRDKIKQGERQWK